MDVIIDGESNFTIEGEPELLLDIINAAVKNARERERAVVAVMVDGEAHSPESLADLHAKTKPEEAGKLELTTRPISELIEESLKELEESLPDLPSACRQLAEVFQSETPEQGFEPFTELARIWEHVKLRQQMLADVLELDLSELKIDGRTLTEHANELNEFLKEAAQALEDGDTVLLGDLLEYELAPRAELEARVTDGLRQEATSS